MKRAFVDLNLRRNPFGELDPADLAAVALVDLDPIRTALDQGLSVQLVGRCGRGKSTHLRALQHTLPAAHYARIWSLEHSGRWPPKVPRIPVDTKLLLLDEADVLPIWSRVGLLRRAAQVVLATHGDLGLSLRLAGHRSVCLPVARPTDLTWLREAVNRRIVYFRRTDAPVPMPDDGILQGLIEAHGDDLWAIERALYEHYQNRSL